MMKTIKPLNRMTALTMILTFGLFGAAQLTSADEAAPATSAAISADTHQLNSHTDAAKSKKTDASAKPLLTVYKSATCGCCTAWIEHMTDNGFNVEAHDTDNLHEYKVKAKLGAGMGSCHTAFVEGYAIEGHVPAADVKKMLKQKPDISGLTAPGMPMNSPGMAPKGSKPSDYDVISYKDGKVIGVFTKY